MKNTDFPSLEAIGVSWGPLAAGVPPSCLLESLLQDCSSWILLQDSSSRLPPPQFLLQDSSSRIPPPGFLLQDFSRIPPGFLLYVFF